MNRCLADPESDAQGGKLTFTDREFETLTSLIEEKTGLAFPAEKRREFLLKLDKLEPIDGVNSAKALIAAASSSDETLQRLINVLTVGESYFFRNRPHFNALKNVILPQLIEDARERRTLNIWCAGCANGEEAYTLAIIMLEFFSLNFNSWDIGILATDISISSLNI